MAETIRSTSVLLTISVVVSEDCVDTQRHQYPKNQEHKSRPLGDLIGTYLAGLYNSSHVQKGPSLKSTSVIRNRKSEKRLTEMSSATPVQLLSLLIGNRFIKPYTTSAPIGVDALNAARCFRQSGRGRDVERSDVVSAKAVGASAERSKSDNVAM